MSNVIAFPKITRPAAQAAPRDFTTEVILAAERCPLADRECLMAGIQAMVRGMRIKRGLPDE